MMEDFKFYEVGGKIRDELLGLTNKDVDYVAVPTDELFKHGYTAEQMFTVLLDYLHSKKFEVFLVTEDCYTIRAKFPDVMIMCEQMATYFGEVKVALEKEKKLKRLEERLAKYEWKQGN